jgi:LytTr DNA-binding domain-containing protein
MLRNTLWLRYGVAILLTTLLMIWVALNKSTSRSDAPGQILFWASSVTAGWLQMILIARGVRASFAKRDWPGWALMTATALIGAVPLTFEIRWLLETILAPAAGLPPPWLTYLNVSVINMVFCLVQYALIERWSLGDQAQGISSSGDCTGPQEAIRPQVSLLTRRPDGLTGEILYLKMEDHYLHVTTPEGRGLVLHRMSDASRDLAAADGLQVHKSWWVARSAVQDIRKINRKRTILALDGTNIPIGRSFEPHLRAAGWL